jgi:hypothetical protein
MSSFPWEVTKDNLNDFFEGPHLFSALYRIYRGAYYSQGFQLSGSSLKIDNRFQKCFDQLPIELKRLILSKVWESGQHFNTLRVYKGELLLPLKLQFLFVQYGRLKHTTQPLISKGCGAWNGCLLKKSIYVFTYDTPNLKSKTLIPDFLNRDAFQILTRFLTLRLQILT